MIDVLIVFPALLVTLLGYYFIITKQYLVHDAKIGHFVFWISATAQGILDYINIYFAETSTYNEVIVGGISFFCIVATSMILIVTITKKNNSLYSLIDQSETGDKLALVIFVIFICIFLYLEHFYIFENNQAYEHAMASIAILLDFVGLYIIWGEVNRYPFQQYIIPWILWGFGLLWFCILEVYFNYQGNDSPSIGWIMLIENFFVVVIIIYFIYTSKKKNLAKK